MALISFCGLLTLQVGAAILAAVFFTLAGVILAANVFDYHNPIEDGWVPFSLLFMIIFVIFLIIAGLLMFVSSYTESRSLAIISVIVIAILLCYWIILCMFSFLNNPDHINGICIEKRCPESFWIANLGYRRQWVPEEEEEVGGAGSTPPSTKKPSGKRRKKRDEADIKNASTRVGIFKRPIEKEYTTQAVEGKNKTIFLHDQSTEQDSETSEEFKVHQDDNRGDFDFKALDIVLSDINITNDFVYDKSLDRRRRQSNKESTNPPSEGAEYANDDKLGNKKTKPKKKSKKGQEGGEEEEEPSRYVFGLPFIGAIILFILNLIFLIFSALVMYSWAQELDWADYYYEDDPVVIVEDY